MSVRTPSLEQILNGRASKILGDFFVCLPAIVDSYDSVNQCVDATPCVTVEVTLEDGSTAEERLPMVLRAPVQWPGAGGSGITFPIKRGDVVRLEFTSVALAQWLSVGGFASQQDGARHGLGSALAVPGGHSFGGSTRPQMTPASDGLTAHGTKVRLGSEGADDPVVRKSDLDAVVSKLNAAIAKLDSHVHSGVTTGAGTSGPPVSGSVGSLTPPACSTRVFSE